MAGSDFSTRTYTYAMTENDTLLHHFTLQMEDHVYKVQSLETIASTRVHAGKYVRKARYICILEINFNEIQWRRQPRRISDMFQICFDYLDRYR